ncbi:MAG: Uma2 family endonuclease [Caldilineaceae bacterium]
MDAALKLLTPAEYLAFERKSKTKHEYYAGRIVEMAGATKAHNLIGSNVIFILMRQLRGRSGEVYPSDMRVKIPATGLYTYPDVIVVATEALLEDAERDILLNPTIIVEVLSASTENYDRGEKFHSYRTIESLQEYVMIAQDSHHIEHYVRQPNGQWLLSEATSLAETIHLPTIDCALPLSDVYDKVTVVPKTASSRFNGHVN